MVNNLFILDEKNVRSHKLPPDIQALKLVSSAPVNYNHGDIDAALEGQLRTGSYGGLHTVILDRSSRLKSLGFLRFLPNLTACLIQSSQVADFTGLRATKVRRLAILSDRRAAEDLEIVPRLGLEKFSFRITGNEDEKFISQCSGFPFLEMYDWISPDLFRLGNIGFDSIQIQSRKLETLQGVSSKPFTAGARQRAFILYSPRLRDVSALKVDFLHLQNCPKVDWHSVAKVKGLKSLSLWNVPPTFSFDFVANAVELEKLSVTGRLRKDIDLEILGRAPKLKEVFLPLADVSKLRALSMKCSNVLVTSPRLMIKAGEIVDERPHLHRGPTADDAEFGGA